MKEFLRKWDFTIMFVLTTLWTMSISFSGIEDSDITIYLPKLALSICGLLFCDILLTGKEYRNSSYKSHSNYCLYLSLACILLEIVLGTGYWTVFIFASVGFIFETNGLNINTPKAITLLAEGGSVYPRVNEIYFKSLIHDMMFYINTNQLEYRFKINCDFEEDVDKDLFIQDLETILPLYCDKFKILKVYNNLHVCIYYTNFENQKEFINKLKKETNYE